MHPWALSLLSHVLPVTGIVLSYCRVLPSLLLAFLSQKKNFGTVALRRFAGTITFGFV